MTLTRDFKETIKARADRDPEFRQALQNEAEQLLQVGDVDAAQTIRATLIETDLPPRTIPSFKLEPVTMGRPDLAVAPV